MRKTAEYTWTDCKTNTQVTKELKITPFLYKLLEYKSNWIQHVNRMPRNRLPRVMKHYSPTGRRNYGRPLKRLLDTRDWNGSTSGPTPWQIYDDDEEDDDCLIVSLIRCVRYPHRRLYCQCLAGGVNRWKASTCTCFHLQETRRDDVKRQTSSTCTYFHM